MFGFHPRRQNTRGLGVYQTFALGINKEAVGGSNKPYPLVDQRLIVGLYLLPPILN